MQNYSRGIFLACVTALFWGFLAIALKLVVVKVHVLTVAWFRFAFAFVLLLSWMVFKNRTSTLTLLKKPPYLAFIAGAALATNYFGFTYGLSLTSPSHTQILIQLGPLLLIVLGVVVFKETLSRRQIAGFAVALLGFSLFYYDQLKHGVNNADTFLLGNIWIVLAAIVWAIYAAIQKYLVQHLSSAQVNLIVYGCAAILLAPLCHFSDFLTMGTYEWSLMLFLGFNTIIAYGALAEAFLHAPANVISIIITLNPLITLAIMSIGKKLSWDFLPEENVLWQGYVGAMITLLGASMVVLKPNSKKVSGP